MAFQQAPLLYCAIGDSLTVGVGTDLFSPGFVGRYHQSLEQTLKHPVVVKKIARNGATSADILNAVKLPLHQEFIQSSEVITLTSGANDLIQAGERFLIEKNVSLLFQAMNTAIENIEKIIECLHSYHLAKSHPFILRLQNLYNPFSQFPEADQWIEQFNARLLAHTTYPNTKLADIHTAFEGKQNQLLVPGGVHPNDKGYEVIANTLTDLGFDPLIPIA